MDLVKNKKKNNMATLLFKDSKLSYNFVTAVLHSTGNHWELTEREGLSFKKYWEFYNHDEEEYVNIYHDWKIKDFIEWLLTYYRGLEHSKTIVGVQSEFKKLMGL